MIAHPEVLFQNELATKVKLQNSLLLINVLQIGNFQNIPVIL